MKKLLLLLLTCTLSSFAMEMPKQNLKKRTYDAVEPKYTEPYFRTDTKALCIDALLNQTHVGEIQYFSINGLGRISLMKVSESYRKLGIGFNLFKDAIDDLYIRGCSAIIWDAVTPVHKDILELQSIYQHMVNKLKTSMDLDFVCGSVKKTAELNAIPMKIIIKRA